MSDFDDLRQVREAKENAEALARQKKLGEERRQAAAAKSLEEKMIGYTRNLGDIVTSVMEDLRKAVYPTLRTGLGSPLTLDTRDDTFKAFWAISRYYGTEDSDPVLKVTLDYSKQGEPTRFVVKRKPFGMLVSEENSQNPKYTEVYFEPVTCGLTRNELIHALRLLHPSHTIG